MTKITCALCVIFLTAALVGSAKAQEDAYAYGFTDVNYDPAYNRVKGYHRTEIDYSTGGYYTPYVCGSLFVGGVEQTRSCYGGILSATRNTQINGLPELVEAITDHYVDVYFYDEGSFSYLDYFGYSFLPGSQYEIGNVYFPPIIYAEILFYSVYLGSTWTQATPTCKDECLLCKSDRRNRIIICTATATACELAAWGVYNNAIQSCDNQAYCNPANPNFNQAQCDSCKDTAQNNLLIMTGACGATATGCFLTLPNCNGKIECPANTPTCKN